MQHGVRTDETYIIQQSRELLANKVESVWLHLVLHSASVNIMLILNY